MAKVKNEVSNGKETGRIIFQCPGCNDTHVLTINREQHPVWKFNGDYDKPTFFPSILHRSGHYADGNTDSCWCRYAEQHPEEIPPFKCGICHSFVTDGMIQFLSDCTHELAGKTVPLPDIEE